MKAAFLSFCAAALLLTGCKDKSKQSTAATNANSSAGNPLDAPGDYLRGLAKGQQSAVKTVDTSSINRAIQMFTVDQGRNPKDLNELVEKKYLPKIPDAPYGMKLVYDPNAGSVSVVPQ
jgi:hypothetical protein